MISKSKFFALSAVMMIIFIMFQFVGNSIDIFFDFNENVNAEYVPLYGQTDMEKAGYGSYMCFKYQDGTAAIVTEKEDDIPGVTDACDYLKIKYTYIDSLSALDIEHIEQYSLIVIGVYNFVPETDVDILKAFLSGGVNVVFAIMPDLSVLKNESTTAEGLTQYQKDTITKKNQLRREMRQMLGIQTIEADSREINGITLFAGFLLGGKAIYTKTDEMTIPHISKLFASGKAYVMGILDDWQTGLEYRNEVLPHIIWRNTYTGSYVFTVNADFMRYSTGIGYFTSMLSEMCGTFAYPIINAQTMLLNNIPTLSEENAVALSEYYNQSIQYFIQTNVLPSINSVLNQTGFVPTYFALSHFSASMSKDSGAAENSNLMQFYLKQARKQNGELGISGYYGEDGYSRIETDLELFSEILPEYAFTVLYSADMTKQQFTKLLEENIQLDRIQTIVRPIKENGDIERIEYLNDDVLIIPQTDNGYVHSDNDDMVLRSIITALGCSNSGIDGHNIVYPGEDEEWTVLATDWAKYTYTFWYPFKKFDKLTVSQADARIRSYLSTSYKMTQDGDTTYIEATGFTGEAYVIISSANKKITRTKGCKYKKIEEGTYLLQLTKSSAQVTMANIQTEKYE